MFKYKRGDKVTILTGKDKNQTGVVEKVLISENKLVVSGINIYKRHRKATRNQKAGIYEVKRPIDAAKVAIVCPKCTKPTRIGFTTMGGKKIRTCRKCQGEIIFKE